MPTTPTTTLPPPPVRLLTVKELAELFQVRPRKVYDLVRDEGLPHVRLGRALRFDPGTIRRWVDARTGSVPTPGAASRTRPLPPGDWSRRRR